MKKQSFTNSSTFNPSYLKRLCLLISTIFCFGCAPEIPEDIQNALQNIPEKIDYNFQVKPILADRCYTCHGPDPKKRKANLRLDEVSSAFTELQESPGKFALVSGKLHKSQVFHRIISDDPERVMPPPDSHLSLSNEEKAILIKWIEQGANYTAHWSFIPPKSPALPAVRNVDWVHNPVDQFILEELEKKKWMPSPRAKKEHLIRRLSFDIRGIAPTLEEIDAFLADQSSGAYEKLIDQFLASPEYGERMAAIWLDVARYADSDGYLDDKHRDFSPWRDWVINAFNNNMPYNQFVSWQLAGDLIPNPTQESKLATAFNRLHKKNSEAGIVFEEYRLEYVADRTHTFGKAFSGLSLECARCHDHKYDPISQEDYYKVFAFFNSTFEIGTPVYGPDQTPGPALMLTDPEQEAILKFLNKKIIGQEQQLVNYKEKALENFRFWKRQNPLNTTEIEERITKNTVAHHSFDQVQYGADNIIITTNLANPKISGKLKEPHLKTGIKGQAFFVDDYNSATFGEKIGWFERTDPFSIDLWLYPEHNYEKAGIFHHCEELRLGYKGYSLHLEQNKLRFILAHSWPQNAIEVLSKSPLKEKGWSHISLTYDGSSKANGIKIFVNGEPQELETKFDHLYKGILFEPNIHTYGFAGFGIGYRDKITPFKGGGLDEVKIFNRTLTPLEVLYQHDPNKVEEMLNRVDQPATEKLLFEYYLAYEDKDFQTIEDSLYIARYKLNQLLNEQKEIMIMGDLTQPRPTFILERGQYDRKGKQVQVGTPSKIFPFKNSLPTNRWGLAQWLFDENNPLTARVLANRIWQMHFGQGLVSTPEDFGYQGALPSHPELLDWLAVRFMEMGWDIKKLHQLIFQSATYQQSSVVTPEAAEKDPENIFLARGPRFRLPAEMIRDNALAVCQLLNKRIGGESVYPYQPAGLWDELSNKSWRYPYLQEAGPGLYRRSIYTIWKRTSPPPAMLIFDASDRGTCTVRRKLTNTPLQALVLLNDPQYLEAARVLAENLMKESNNPTIQLQKAFRLLTSRQPDKKEVAILHRFYEKEVINFSENETDANAYLSIGEQAWDSNLPYAPLAALTVVINSIMNTDEAQTKT